MTTNIRNANDKIIVEISGMLKGSTAEQFTSAVEPLTTQNGQNVVLDCDELGFISKEGMEAIKAFSDKLQANGSTLKLINLGNEIKDMLEMAGYDKFFTIGR